jgi:hypothetical protein
MRKFVIAAAFAAAVIASPALAQGQSGSHGPPGGAGGGGVPGGGLERGQGAGPPIAPPGLGSGDARDAARAIAEQRGAFGRDFADDRSGLTGSERAAFQREQAAQYFAAAQARREQAQQYSTALHNGARLPADAAKDLRAALRADMEAWREAFRVDRQEWQDLRDQWIADRDELTTEQWAQRRLDWFVFRDAWAAQHGYSTARAGD